MYRVLLALGITLTLVTAPSFASSKEDNNHFLGVFSGIPTPIAKRIFLTGSNMNISFLSNGERVCFRRKLTKPIMGMALM